MKDTGSDERLISDGARFYDLLLKKKGAFLLGELLFNNYVSVYYFTP